MLVITRKRGSVTSVRSLLLLSDDDDDDMMVEFSVRLGPLPSSAFASGQALVFIAVCMYLSLEKHKEGIAHQPLNDLEA
eukprot:scaffold13680_cov98-Skeletonema_marinoi.AAC.4